MTDTAPDGIRWWARAEVFFGASAIVWLQIVEILAGLHPALA